MFSGRWSRTFLSLCSWQRPMTGLSKTSWTPAASGLAPSSTAMIGLVVSRPRSRSPVSRVLTTVVFSVDPSTNPSGCLVPSMSMPSATTHRCSAKYTPSIINATRSKSVRSLASRSVSAVSVMATNSPGDRRLAGRPRRLLDRLADGLQAGPVVPGREPAEHPLHGHPPEQFGAVEHLLRRHRQLTAAVGRADSRSAYRHPSAAQGDRPGFGAVPGRRAVRVVLALQTARRGHIRLHQLLLDLESVADREGEQSLAHVGSDLLHRNADMVGHGKCRRIGHGRLILLGHSGPLSLGVLGGSPETYHPVGLGRGTATSSSTRPGTTSRDAPDEERHWAYTFTSTLTKSLGSTQGPSHQRGSRAHLA